MEIADMEIADMEIADMEIATVGTLPQDIIPNERGCITESRRVRAALPTNSHTRAQHQPLPVNGSGRCCDAGFL
jgi:hypothetical protein